MLPFGKQQEFSEFCFDNKLRTAAGKPPDALFRAAAVALSRARGERWRPCKLLVLNGLDRIPGLEGTQGTELVALDGFEPPYAESESAVLPLNERALP